MLASSKFSNNEFIFMNEKKITRNILDDDDDNKTLSRIFSEWTILTIFFLTLT